MALSRLGPEYTFQTRVLAAAPPDAAGPHRRTVAPRRWRRPEPLRPRHPLPHGPDYRRPSRRHRRPGAARSPPRGVRGVTGDIVGDDTWYVWEPYAVGWGLDDPESDDGPPISALTVNDNAFTLSVRPGAREGDPAVLTLGPADRVLSHR